MLIPAYQMKGIFTEDKNKIFIFFNPLGEGGSNSFTWNLQKKRKSSLLTNQLPSAKVTRSWTHQTNP